jgi:hypothetical protein
MKDLLLLELETDISDMIKFRTNYYSYKNRFSFFRKRNRLNQIYWFNEYIKQREYIRRKYNIIKIHNF